MRNIYLPFMAIALFGCSSVENRHTLLVDFNGTVESPLYAYSLDETSQIIDTALLSDGQYIFDVTSWPLGYYRLSSDSSNSLDIIVGDVDQMLICARRNHLSESTTNSRQTQLLWQVCNLASNMSSLADSVLAPSLADSLFSSFRHQADQLRLQSDTSLAALRLLSLSFNGKPLYDMITDHAAYESSIQHLKSALPSSVAVQQLSAKVDSTRELASFLARYSKGQKAPQFHMTTVNNTNVTNADLDGIPYVFYLTTDTTSQAESKWQQVAINRFNGYKVVAAIPSNLSRIHNLNVLQGSILPSELASLSAHQPLTIFVNTDGNITSMTYGK